MAARDGGDGDLVGMVALVTGAGQGIGRGIAERLARGGADVAINDLDEAAAGRVADEVRALGRRAAALPADVGEVRQIEAMIGRTVETLPARSPVVFRAPDQDFESAMWSAS